MALQQKDIFVNMDVIAMLNIIYYKEEVIAFHHQKFVQVFQMLLKTK